MQHRPFVLVILLSAATASAATDRPIKLTEEQCEKLFWSFYKAELALDSISSCTTRACNDARETMEDLQERIKSFWDEGDCDQYRLAPLAITPISSSFYLP